MGSPQDKQWTMGRGGLKGDVGREKFANERARFRHGLPGKIHLEIFRERRQEMHAEVLLINSKWPPKKKEQPVFEPQKALRS